MKRPEPINVHFDGTDVLWTYVGKPTMFRAAFLGELTKEEKESGFLMRLAIQYRHGATQLHTELDWHNEKLPREGVIGAAIADKRLKQHLRNTIEASWNVLSHVHDAWVESCEAYHLAVRDALDLAVETATEERRKAKISAVETRDVPRY